MSSAEMCRQYRLDSDDTCQVSRWLLPHRDAARWMSGYKLSGLDVHHICGRGRAVEFGWYCNLILVDKAAHAWAHDKCPSAFEICCFKAKMELNRCDLDECELAWYDDCRVRSMPDFDKTHWSPIILNGLVRPFVSLAARIDHLKNSVKGTVFETYSNELLKALGE